MTVFKNKKHHQLVSPHVYLAGIWKDLYEVTKHDLSLHLQTTKDQIHNTFFMCTRLMVHEQMLCPALHLSCSSDQQSAE